MFMAASDGVRKTREVFLRSSESGQEENSDEEDVSLSEMLQINKRSKKCCWLLTGTATCPAL